MKKYLLITLLCPFVSFGQDLDEDLNAANIIIPKYSLTIRPYLQPSFFRSKAEVVSNNFEFVNINGADVRLNYSIMEVFTVGSGVGVHGFNLRMNNNTFWQELNDDDEIDDVDFFGQQVLFVSVPIEIGIAPRLFRGGWFEPRLTVGVTPHFMAKRELIIEFNETTTLSQSQKDKIINNFTGGAREVYTSLDVTAEFKFWPGAEKRAGIGLSFAYIDNLVGPQTYLLRDGRGFLAGFTVSARF
ncbi:hypothetical protein JYT74_01890 [Crocinitomix catalasitica]|nr:hypothetical protein [Crocinitomix catalasitica]